MLRIALSMLVGNAGKFLGMVAAVAFATMLITQQAAIFQGVMGLTYGPISDTYEAEVWVSDPRMAQVENTGGLPDRYLDMTRGVAGVRWAVPLNRNQVQMELADGSLEAAVLMGIDDATLIGGPSPASISGCDLSALRRHRSLIVDASSAAGKLRIPGRDGPRDLGPGDGLLVNGLQFDVVGTCATTMSLMQMPVLYMRRSASVDAIGTSDCGYNMILVGTAPGADRAAVCAAITAATGLAASESRALEDKTYEYFLFNSGIPANFAIAICLGFVIGIAITVQTYHQFILDGRTVFATLKAMGLRTRQLGRMVALQTTVVAILGYGTGIGGAALLGHLLRGSSLSYRLEPMILGLAFAAVLLISLVSAFIGVRILARVQPCEVFRA